MRALLLSVAALIVLGLLPACDDQEVPDIAGDWVCDLEPVSSSWCNDGEDRPQIVTNMNGSVAVSRDVHAHGRNVPCSSCGSPNEYDLEFEAVAVEDSLKSVEVTELRHGQYPTPERDFFGYPSHPQSCRAVHRGTCTRATR